MLYMCARVAVVVKKVFKNQNTPRPSEHPPVIVSHIQRFGCQPEKVMLHNENYCREGQCCSEGLGAF